MPVEQKPESLDGPGSATSAVEFRRILQTAGGPTGLVAGVNSTSSLAVTPVAGLRALQVEAGIAFVPPASGTDVGVARCRLPSAQSTADFEAPGINPGDGANPRIDRIVAQLYDEPNNKKWRLRVLHGTPTAGATLAGSAAEGTMGKAPQPLGAIPIARFITVAGMGNVAYTAEQIAAERIDARTGAAFGGSSGGGGDAGLLIPQLKTATGEMVAFDYARAGHPLVREAVGSTASDRQAAALVYLPRSITFTRLRFRNRTDISGGNGFCVALYNATTGALIVGSGAIAWATGERSLIVASTTLAAGWYYVMYGYGGGASGTFGVFHGVGFVANQLVGSLPNGFLVRSPAAGTGQTAPADLSAFTDTVVPSAGASVPVVALSAA